MKESGESAANACFRLKAGGCGVQTYAKFLLCWNNQPVLAYYLLTCRHLYHSITGDLY